VTREQSLNLSKKYHRIGRKQVAIDYVPTIRLKKFWIIEAKPGNPKEMDFGDYLQAHLDAIHPEINARFIMVTNGWEIRVYDAISSNSWEDYILMVNQQNCDFEFEQLRQLLSSQSITKALRTHVLSVIAESLKVEIDESEASRFKSDMMKIYLDALPIIRQNAYEFKVEAWKKNEQEAGEWIKNIPFSELLIWMDRPTDALPWYAEECVRRILESAQTVRDELVGKLAMTYRGRPHGVFKVQCIYVFCRLLDEGVEASYKGYAASVYRCLEELVESNMNYWAWPHGDKIDHIGFALCNLDNICARLSYKICRRFAFGALSKLAEAKKEAFSPEDLLVDWPSTAKEVVGAVRFINEMLWRKYMGGDSQKIWDAIWTLENMEEQVNQMPAIPYSDGDTDFLNFDHYGIDFDMYCVGTWNVLTKWKDKATNLTFPPNAIQVMSKSREQVINEIPKPIPRPQERKYDQKVPLEMIVELFKFGT